MSVFILSLIFFVLLLVFLLDKNRNNNDVWIILSRGKRKYGVFKNRKEAYNFLRANKNTKNNKYKIIKCKRKEACGM